MTRVDPSTFVAGGAVQAGGGVYLERAADAQILEHCRAGHFTYVLTSRQMGKSSLMVRTAERLAAEGVLPVVIDLTELGAQTTAEQWYKGLLTTIQDQLRLGTSAAEWWSAHEELPIGQRFTRYLREVALAERREQIVIFVDEIDTTLRLPFTDDFFTGIRFVYQTRAVAPELNRLSFVLLGVATPGDLIKDPARTPFNVGYRVELDDFTVDETVPLATHLSVPPAASRALIGWIHRWTSGHPYLTLSVVRSLAETPPEAWTAAAVDERVRALFFRAGGETDSNLQFVRDMLTRKAFDRDAVLRTYRDVRRGRRVPDKELDQVVSWLKLSGVVRSRDGALQVRNAVYRRVFDDRWARQHLQLSVDWGRRLAHLATAILVLTVAVTLPLAVYAWKLKTEAEFQTREAQVQRDEAMQLRAAAERTLADRETSLATVHQALEALQRLTPQSAALTPGQASKDREQAQTAISALNTQLQKERDEAMRVLGGAKSAGGQPGGTAAARPPRVAPAPASRPAPKAVPQAPEVAAVLNVLRRYEAAYAARNLAALRRVQALSAAEAAALKQTFADSQRYTVRLYSEDVRIAADGRHARVTAAMDRTVTGRSTRRQETAVPVFTLERRGSAWIITSVNVDMSVR